VVDVRGKLVPYIMLRDWFGVDGEKPEIEQVVIVNLEGERFGFVVDEVVGQIQAVMKSLGTFYERVRGLGGATILGDGTVALIIDPMELEKLAVSGAELVSV
jgi:two-component system chemotaxis sensor kinase CheA